jgi:hypothetical protein
MEKFSSDPACNIMLASIGAAGEGCVNHFGNWCCARTQAY